MGTMLRQEICAREISRNKAAFASRSSNREGPKRVAALGKAPPISDQKAGPGRNCDRPKLRRQNESGICADSVGDRAGELSRRAELPIVVRI
jgi:hypothetical protein